MRIYSKLSVLFYLDPLCLSPGKKNKYSFMIDDLRDMKKSMDSRLESYLINLSLFEKGEEDVFGNQTGISIMQTPLMMEMVRNGGTDGNLHENRTRHYT